jgi:hypothetical protein
MICFHGTPFGFPVTEILDSVPRRNFLVSFAAPCYKDVLPVYAKRLILDNGAFSIWKKGAGKIDIIKYSDFVKEWATLPAYRWNFIPDIIEGTCQENDANIDTWLKVYGDENSVPVWHYHEPLDRLKALGNHFPIVGLGSSAMYKNVGDAAWLTRTKEIFEFTHHHVPFVKLHGLRVLNYRIFTKFPYYSGDSTNVARNSKFYRNRHNCQTLKQAVNALADSIEQHKSLYVYSVNDQP